MSKKDFQNGFALGLASGGVVEIEKEEQEKVVDITENGTTEVTPDEGMSLSKVTVNVAIESGGDEGLPDWDDDSPIIASGNGYYTSTIWEVTEKGTMRWRMNPEGTGSGVYYNAAGWGNTIRISSQRHIPVSSKIKQLDIGEGITKIWLGYMPNCKRIRVAEEMETVALIHFDSLPHIIVDNFKEFSLQQCGSIERVELPETLTALKPYAFSNSYNIKEVNLQNIVTFDNNCFNSCVNLSSDITFNANLKAINTKAFIDCSIKSLTFKNSTDSLPTIAKDAFNGCTQLLNIYCPWALDEVSNAPWGAPNVTIWYGVAYVENGIPYNKDGNPITQEE